MSTIALYKSQADQMNQLISDTMVSVDNYISELSSVKNNAFYVTTSVCNLEDVISSIVSSIDTQELKFSALDTMWLDTETFIWNVDVIDQDVADLINEAKDDFYDDYYYLKPECEKDLADKAGDLLVSFVDGVISLCSDIAAIVDTGLKAIGDFFTAVGQWCVDHWKVVVTVLLVIAAVAIIFLSGGTALGVLGPLFLLMAKGIIVGAVIGGFAGGFASKAFGGSFWEGFEDGAFSGAITGAITGFFGPAASASAHALRNTMLLGGAANAYASFYGNLGDVVIKGDDVSVNEFLFDSTLSFILGAGFSGFGFKLDKLCPVKIPDITSGNGSFAHVWSSGVTRSLTQGTRVSLRVILKGLVADTLKNLPDDLLEFPSAYIQEGIDQLLPWNQEKVPAS